MAVLTRKALAHSSILIRHPDHPQNWITCSFCIPWILQKDPSITFWVILLTHRQTNKLWQKHNLLGGGNNLPSCPPESKQYCTRMFKMTKYIKDSKALEQETSFNRSCCKSLNNKRSWRCWLSVQLFGRRELIRPD